jgi:hypothetical protein
MASMLNSTAKQAIQAIASRCRDMGQNPLGGRSGAGYLA